MKNESNWKCWIYIDDGICSYCWILGERYGIAKYIDLNNETRQANNRPRIVKFIAAILSVYQYFMGKTRQVYNGPCVEKFIAAILSVYQYFLDKQIFWQKFLSGKTFDKANCN